MPRPLLPFRLVRSPDADAPRYFVSAEQARRLGDAVGISLPCVGAWWSVADLPGNIEDVTSVQDLLRSQVMTSIWLERHPIDPGLTAGQKRQAYASIVRRVDQLVAFLASVDDRIVDDLRETFDVDDFLERAKQLGARCEERRQPVKTIAPRATRGRRRAVWLFDVVHLFDYLTLFGCGLRGTRARRRLTFVRTMAELAAVRLPTEDKDLERILPRQRWWPRAMTRELLSAWERMLLPASHL